MNEVLLIGISGIISSVLTAGGAILVNYLKQKTANEIARQESLQKYNLDDTDKAFEMYQKIIDRMEHNITSLKEDIEKLQQQNQVCIEDRAQLRAEVKSLTDKIKDLEAKLEEFRKKI